jgi:regulator of sigma E protease
MGAVFSVLLNIILFVLILGILVFVHELGHFLVAKKCGVYIYEFSIGMGPAIKTIKGKDGINYSIRALPLGGYVQMAGEIYEDDDSKKIPKKQFMCNRPWWQRLLILCAGVFNNFVLALLLLFFIALIWGARSLNPTVDGVVEGSAAEQAGIKAGDVIGLAGNTGASEGVHLHYSIWKPIKGSYESDRAIDPRLYQYP